MSTLKEWREALKNRDAAKTFYHAEMVDLLKAAEKEVDEALNPLSHDRVIKHTLKGELDITVSEALNAHTLTVLLQALPLPTFHHITKVDIRQEGEYNDKREWVESNRWDVHIDWVEYLTSL